MSIVKPISNVECCDCLIAMANFPDKFFELAIVDPPYGANNKWVDGGGTNKLRAKIEHWDHIPDQIVWGGNYFTEFLPISSRWISFEKFGLPQCPQFELAWTSLNIANKIFKADRRDININWGIWIHPTQKPIKLYKWLLNNYAKPGDKILDTHMGSQSSRIAAYHMGFDYWGYEIDAEYFEAGNKRFKEQTMQLSLL